MDGTLLSRQESNLRTFAVRLLIASLCIACALPGRAQDVPPDDSAIISQTPIVFPPAFFRQLTASRPGMVIEVPFPGRQALRVTTREVRRTLNGFSWFGQIPVRGVADVTFVVAGRTLLGAMRFDTRYFRISPAADGGYLMLEIDRARVADTDTIDTDRFDDTGIPREVKAPPGAAKAVAAQIAELQAAQLFLRRFATIADHVDLLLQLIPEDGSRIDVMILLERGAADYLRTRGIDIGAEAAFQVAQANDIYAASGVQTRLNLVHFREIDYEVQDALLQQDLDDLAGGAIPGVTALRDTFRADLVSLFVLNDLPKVGNPPQRSAGIGKVLIDTAEPGDDPVPYDGRGLFAGYGYNVVSLVAALEHDSVFTHEISHNLGAGHDPYTFDLDPDSKGRFHYSRGLILPGSRVRTVMSYQKYCAVFYHADCPVIPRLSNPLRGYYGEPLGLLEVNDNVKTLNLNAWTVANFRNANWVTPLE